MKSELKLYVRSKNNIWTDKWISQNMLSAHLNPDSDAASRNIHVINTTIDWITTIIKKDSTVLDLGCGPGLYAEILSKKGYTVTGLDISKRSIRYAKKSAKEKKLPVTYITRDYIKRNIHGKFDNVLCIYCDFGALLPSEQVILLKNIHNALDKDGVFIFDVFTEGLSDSRKECKQWNYYKDGSFWSKKPHFVLEENIHFPKNNTWGSRSIVIDNKIREYITWDTYYSKKQITELLNANGFKVEEIKENLVERSDFTSNAVIFIKAKKTDK